MQFSSFSRKIPNPMIAFSRIVRIATFAFPVWVLLASVVALYQPGVFTWFSGALITLALGVTMMCMGLTLEIDDFRRVALQPRLIGVGVALQYLVMPFLGWSIASVMELPTPFAVGLILVSCCPGGVASNVISYLALADVPLSVSLTAVSTSISVLMTPALTAMYASSRVGCSRGWTSLRHTPGRHCPGGAGADSETLRTATDRPNTSGGPVDFSNLDHDDRRFDYRSQPGCNHRVRLSFDRSRFRAARWRVRPRVRSDTIRIPECELSPHGGD